jgi:hypothetical protein
MTDKERVVEAMNRLAIKTVFVVYWTDPYAPGGGPERVFLTREEAETFVKDELAANKPCADIYQIEKVKVGR